MAIAHTPIFAGITMILILFLGLNVSRIRRREKIFLGDGGNKDLIRAQRVHMNLLEHALPILFLLLIFEVQGAGKLWIMGIGGAFVVFRLFHAIGFFKKIFALGFIGATGTYLIELVLGIMVIYKAIY